MLSNGSSSRLAVVVEDGLRDVDVLLLAEAVGGLVLGMVLLHAGKALGGSDTGLLLVLEALSFLELALLLVVLLAGCLALVFPGNKEASKSDRRQLANKSSLNKGGHQCQVCVASLASPCMNRWYAQANNKKKKVDLLANNGHRVVGCRDTHASDLDSGSAIDLVLD